MSSTKSPLASVTIMGVIVAGIAAALGYFGFDLLPGEREQLQDMLYVIAEYIGLIIAIFGRWRAKRPLSMKKPSTGDMKP